MKKEEKIICNINGLDRVVYSVGSGNKTILLLNGGPGLPSLYLRHPHSILANEGYRVISYDQLDCGLSARTNDPANWTVSAFADELEALIEYLGLVKPHVLGHSWGTFLAIETALRRPQLFGSLILADGAADIPILIGELNRLRSALGPDTVSLMQRYEAEGRLNHPVYQACITLLNYLHVCRLDEWPESLTQSLAEWNLAVYETMQGPNEFTFTGNYKNWSRLAEIHTICTPTLAVCGQHDELTPLCTALIGSHIPNAQVKIFPNSSHMPFYEEPIEYFNCLRNFLSQIKI